MSETGKKPIGSIRLNNGVIEFINSTVEEWTPFTQSIRNIEAPYYINIDDVGRYIRVDSATDIEITIPAINFPEGSVITFEQKGDGIITLVSERDITLNGGVISNGQFSIMQAINVASSEWTIIGGTV